MTSPMITPIFYHAQAKKFWSAFHFCEPVSICKKSVYYICWFKTSEIQPTFIVTSPDWPHPFLTMPIPKTFNYLLICMNLYQTAKNQLIPSTQSWDTVKFRVQYQIGHAHILTMPNYKIFEHLIFVNLYQYAKNETVLSICSEEIIDLKILQSDWLRAFWPVSEGQDFPPNIGFVQEHSK